MRPVGTKFLQGFEGENYGTESDAEGEKKPIKEFRGTSYGPCGRKVDDFSQLCLRLRGQGVTRLERMSLHPSTVNILIFSSQVSGQVLEWRQHGNAVGIFPLMRRPIFIPVNLSMVYDTIRLWHTICLSNVIRINRKASKWLAPCFFQDPPRVVISSCSSTSICSVVNFLLNAF